MIEAADPPQRDMSKTWEGNRQRRRRRLADELNTSGRWLARPLETDPIPDTPGVYLSDTIAEDPRFVAAGAPAIALWMRALMDPDRRVVDGHAVISAAVTAELRHDGGAERALIDAGLWEYDIKTDCFVFADPGQVYAIVGESA